MADLSTVYLGNITTQVNAITSYANSVADGLDGKSQTEIDSTLASLSIYMENSLLGIRTQIISFANAQYCAALDQIDLLDPIINASFTDLASVIDWANALISSMTAGYNKLVSFNAALLLAIVDLSNALIAAATISFPQLPETPSISVTIPAIDASDITTCS